MHIAETSIEGSSCEEFQQMPFLSHAVFICTVVIHSIIPASTYRLTMRLRSDDLQLCIQKRFLLPVTGPPNEPVLFCTLSSPVMRVGGWAVARPHFCQCPPDQHRAKILRCYWLFTYQSIFSSGSSYTNAVQLIIRSTHKPCYASP